jgi:PhnB protein
MRFKDHEATAHVPDKDKNKIMHIALPIGKGNVLMATDSLESLGQKLTVGNNFYITIQPDSKEEADRLFNRLAEGGKVEMPMQDMFWGAYFGSLADKFGIQWMINYDSKQQK